MWYTSSSTVVIRPTFAVSDPFRARTVTQVPGGAPLPWYVSTVKPSASNSSLPAGSVRVSVIRPTASSGRMSIPKITAAGFVSAPTTGFGRSCISMDNNPLEPTVTSNRTVVYSVTSACVLAIFVSSEPTTPTWPGSYTRNCCQSRGWTQSPVRICTWYVWSGTT